MATLNSSPRVTLTLVVGAASQNKANCDPARRDRDLTIYLRFKPGATIGVGQNPTYTKLVEEEIAPRVEQICGEVQTLNTDAPTICPPTTPRPS